MKDQKLQRRMRASVAPRISKSGVPTLQVARKQRKRGGKRETTDDHLLQTDHETDNEQRAKGTYICGAYVSSLSSFLISLYIYTAAVALAVVKKKKAEL